MSEKKSKTCQSCGGQYVPTSNNQKFCPDCRAAMAQDGTVKESFVKYQKARRPGEVFSFKLGSEPQTGPGQAIETAELTEDDAPWEEDAVEISSGGQTQTSYEIMAKLAGEILEKYAKGDLVERPEPVKPVPIISQIERLKDRICKEICKYEPDEEYTCCRTCPLMEL